MSVPPLVKTPVLCIAAATRVWHYGSDYDRGKLISLTFAYLQRARAMTEGSVTVR